MQYEGVRELASACFMSQAVHRPWHDLAHAPRFLAKDCTWNFPLQDYIPKRDNHNVPDVQAGNSPPVAFCPGQVLPLQSFAQARRFWDNNVVHMGLNAEEHLQGAVSMREMRPQHT